MRDDFENFLKSTGNVSDETIQKFSDYYDLLLKWQSKLNLIGNSSDDIWNRHFLDSIQIIKLLPDKNKSILDFGTGAGFPGMVLSILGHDVTLVDSDSKKTIFLSEVKRITKSSAKIFNGRIENLPKESFDVITSRACADLEKLLEYSYPSVSHGTECIFHKGKNHKKEISDAEKKWHFQFAINPSITDSDGVILKLSNITKRSGYDR
ncbi:MAG: 16S rRNA (guanine(527)-N(7))-methyltransferase RsmG [Alphaproteobacteria bacterium]